MIKELRLVQLGDALGLRIPAALVDKYGLQDEVVLGPIPSCYSSTTNTDTSIWGPAKTF